ncbi:MAG TPA: GH92 family glycosyl hydrolase [Actinomycetota bacterium]|nr:GH92 family glycosyl hydrolase [Actinomycetota bacterium]
MISRRGKLASVLVVALLSGPFAPPGQGAAATEPASLVDPFIGTLGAGFVFPGPAAPYGMVQLSPDTEGYFAYTGYQWFDTHIRGFSHVRVQSMGVPEGGEVPFMPTTGAVVTDVNSYQSPFSHATESAEPGYYQVTLPREGIRAELTAGTRVGMHRYTFPAVEQANVLLDIGRQIPGGDLNQRLQREAGTNRASVRIVDDRTVVGTTNVDRASAFGYRVHFAAVFDRPFTSSGVWASRGAPLQPGVTQITGQGAGAAVTFDARGDQDVIVKVGISFVSEANAMANLAAEAPGFDFDGLREATFDAWNDALSVIDVTGGTPAEQISFSTALYHAQHHPNVFNDVNGDYIGHDDQVHRIGDAGDPMPAGSTYYANFSMWDTYRAEMPLLAWIVPDRYRDMMRSLAAIVRWGGQMPRWAMMNRNPNFMNGEPALPVIADGFCRGLVPDDALATLYGEARRVALDARRNPEFYSRGYTRDASNTLEYALADFALALMADRLGHTADRDRLLAQSGSWRNVFDPETRFVRPRNDNGSWYGDPYRPEMPDHFTEGTGWQYTWLVPQDVAGLSDAIGGDEEVRRRLDVFFSTALNATVPVAGPEAQQKATLYGIAYYGNQYAPSNEHDLQAPWLYNWTSEPWKTQAIQRAYQGLYRATPDGLPGNDDLGTMSAWFIWSALGLYPVTPGSPTYTIGSPLFTRAVVHPPGSPPFTIDALGASAADKYVQSAALDGAPLHRTWITHDALTGGATLHLPMGPVPSSWGSGISARPPSSSTTQLADFACQP